MIYSENDLIMPVLSHLLSNKENGLTTSQLISILSEELEISGKDAEILTGRKDTHFSQKVRNLVSHRTLENKGLATYKKIKNDGIHNITLKGEKYLLENINNFNFILENNFNESQRRNIIERDYSDLIIEEGFVKFGKIRTRMRSKKLVEIAKKYYSKNGRINCSACDFNFENFYGDIGKGFIEIHHIKPVFALKNNFEKSVIQAIEDVSPLCSNCHRMIHRDNSQLLSIPSLQKIIDNQIKRGI